MWKALLLAAVVVAGMAAQLARQRGLPPTATLWAEDGAVLWTGSYAEGVSATFRGYAGYAIAGQRLAVLGVSWVHPRHLAWVTAGLAAAVVTLLAVHVWFASAWFLRTQSRRAIGAAFVVLLPAALFEVTGSLVNVQWFLMVNAVLVLLEPTTKGRRTWCDAAIAMVAPLSAPLTMLLVPAAAVVLVRRSGRQRIVPAVFLLAAAVQAVAVSQTEQTASAGRSSWKAVLLFAPRVVGRLAFGEAPFDRLHEAAPAVLLVLCGGLSLALVACAAASAHQRSGAPALLVGAALLFWIAPVALRGAEEMTVVNWYSQRYAVPAIELCLLAVLTPGRRRSQRAGRLQSGLFLAWALLVVVPSVRGVNFRSTGSPWRAMLAREAPACGGGASSVTVGIHPLPETETWVVRVPCSKLGATSAAGSPGPGAGAAGPSPPATTPAGPGAPAAPSSRPATR